MKHTLLWMLSFVILSGCAAGSKESPFVVSAVTQDVKIYRRDDPPSACREIGPVKGVSGTNDMGQGCVLGSELNATNRLRQATVGIGGNALLLVEIKRPVTPIGSSFCAGATDWQYVARGIAFSCPPGVSE